MATKVSTQEMRKMQVADLQTEVTDLRKSIAKMRLGLAMRSEKDSAEFRRQKKAVARMLTVLKEKEGAELKPKAKASNISAPKAK